MDSLPGGSENFDRAASASALDVDEEDSSGLARQRKQLHWDRKRKRFVRGDAGDSRGRNVKMMKTESGVRVPLSYKSDMYVTHS